MSFREFAHTEVARLGASSAAAAIFGLKASHSAPSLEACRGWGAIVIALARIQAPEGAMAELGLAVTAFSALTGNAGTAASSGIDLGAVACKMDIGAN